MGEASEKPGAKTAPVTFRVSTYYKRGRNEHGVTSLDSNRICLSDALGWVLADLPEEAVSLDPNTDENGDVTTLRIDWSKVPGEIRYPFDHGARK
jgi:hypothetical protein